jgi:hypothetical protein
MEDQCKPVVDHQRRLTHAMREVVKKEIIKLLEPVSSTRFRIANGEPGTLCTEERRFNRGEE